MNLLPIGSYTVGMSSIVHQYLDTTLHLLKQMKEIANFDRSVDFDILNDKLTRLWRYMTEEERKYVEAQLKI